MEEEEQGRSWLIWVLIVPVAMAAGVLLTKWALQPGKAARHAPAAEQAAAAVPAGRPAPAAPQNSKPAASDGAGYDLPGDEPAGDTGIIWADKPSAAAPSKDGARPAPTQSAAPAPEAAAAPGDEKKSRTLGFARGAISKAVEKLMNNPKAVSALLNNEYVVKGFMSRDTVKNATASAASLANYMKNPANMNSFMGKGVVRNGMNNQQLVNAVAGSQLVGALLDTPGGRALLNDPNAMGEVLKANPGLVSVITNPAILNALIENPKTAGVVTQINLAGIPH